VIERGELRFGERLPNPFADGEMTVWFHPLCAAYKRPEALLQTLDESPAEVPDREALERAARSSLAHRRLPRIDGAERAPSAQARCRSCREPIARGAGASGSCSIKKAGSLPAGSCTSTVARATSRPKTSWITCSTSVPN
jgi:hypothetical protein